MSKTGIAFLSRKQCDPNQTPHSVTSDLGLHHLLRYTRPSTTSDAMYNNVYMFSFKYVCSFSFSFCVVGNINIMDQIDLSLKTLDLKLIGICR